MKFVNVAHERASFIKKEGTMEKNVNAGLDIMFSQMAQT